jgi:uncharacterized membrane protein
MQIFDLVIVLATLLAAWSFVFLYGFLAKWYKSAAGRHLFWFSLVVSLTYLNTSLRLIFTNLPYRTETTQVILVLVFLVVVQRLQLFLRVLYRDRKDLKESVKDGPE